MMMQKRGKMCCITTTERMRPTCSLLITLVTWTFCCCCSEHALDWEMQMQAQVWGQRLRGAELFCKIEFQVPRTNPGRELGKRRYQRDRWEKRWQDGGGPGSRGPEEYSSQWKQCLIVQWPQNGQWCPCTIWRFFFFWHFDTITHSFIPHEFSLIPTISCKSVECFVLF